MTHQKMQRIVIIGTTGCGKSTLAQRIAKAAGHAYVDLDDLRWLPGWTMTLEHDFIRAAGAALPENGRWVVAGNYSALRPVVWARADTLIWLDYGFFRIFSRLFLRTLRRVATRERVCNGNIENLSKVASKDSILLWFFKTYWRNRKRYGDDFKKRADYPHLQRLRLAHPAEAGDVIKMIAAASARKE